MLSVDDVLSSLSLFLESRGGDFCLAGVSLSILGLFPLCTESFLGGGVGALSSSSTSSSSVLVFVTFGMAPDDLSGTGIVLVAPVGCDR